MALSIAGLHAMSMAQREGVFRPAAARERSQLSSAGVVLLEDEERSAHVLSRADVKLVELRNDVAISAQPRRSHEVRPKRPLCICINAIFPLH